MELDGKAVREAEVLDVTVRDPDDATGKRWEEMGAEIKDGNADEMSTDSRAWRVVRFNGAGSRVRGGVSRCVQGQMCYCCCCRVWWWGN